MLRRSVWLRQAALLLDQPIVLPVIDGAVDDRWARTGEGFLQDRGEPGRRFHAEAPAAERVRQAHEVGVAELDSGRTLEPLHLLPADGRIAVVAKDRRLPR